ncbi:hypothetical protein G6514_004284 [Epicoccum nigrum]|nr:hypothetical protein G6514_004284 [Epicoccum nigrum]
MFHISCVERVKEIFEIMKENHFGEPVKEERFAAVLEQVLLKSQDGQLPEGYRRMLSLIKGILGVVLDQLAKPMGSAEPDRSPPAPRTQATQSQKAGCLKCGAASTKAGNPLLKCAKCKTVKYCLTDCQKKDWKKHKQVCKQMQDEGKQAQEETVGDDEAARADEAKA